MKNVTRTFLSLLLFFNLKLASAAEEYTRHNLDLVDNVIVPGYTFLFESTMSFNSQIRQFCSYDANLTVADLRLGYHDVMDKWQALQWLKTGPGETLLRNHRFQMWPDKHGTGARQTRKILIEKDTAVFEPKRFATGSVAVQGLPIVERLLFDTSETAQPLRGMNKQVDSLDFRCLFLQTVSQNLVQIAGELEAEWKGAYRTAIQTPGEANDYYESPRAATANFLSLISTQLIFMVDNKLKSPLGLLKKNQKVRYKKSESWRSERSIRNIKLNLSALHAAFVSNLDPLITDDGRKRYYQTIWREVELVFSQLPDSIVDSIDEQHEKLLEATENLSMLQQVITQELSAELELPLGFNGLDGD